MKKLIFAVLALSVFACTPTQLEDDRTEPTAFEENGGGCAAPDTNCNGIPDHLE